MRNGGVPVEISAQWVFSFPSFQVTDDKIKNLVSVAALVVVFGNMLFIGLIVYLLTKNVPPTIGGSS